METESSEGGGRTVDVCVSLTSGLNVCVCVIDGCLSQGDGEGAVGGTTQRG